MNYRCQPITPDHYCKQCKRYTTDTADSVFVALDSTDESCAYVLDLRPIVFRPYEERK